MTGGKRTPRTPQQKAQDLLADARARHKRAGEASAKADKALRDAQAAKTAADKEVRASEAAVEYAQQHPDLPADRPAGGAS